MNEPILPDIQPVNNPQIKDLTDQRFGRLTVLGYAGSAPKGQARWLCQCDCGSRIVVTGQSLREGKTQSCRCLANELTSKRNKTHGITKSNPEYRTWCAMRVRCNNSNIGQYKDYGGRGIKICERWNDFLNFLEDMGQRPSPDHSLDRIDVNGDYCPENCRWATRLQQNNNARSNRNITFQGETFTIAQWARRTGIGEATLYNRIVTRGIPAEIALTTPVNKKASQV